jgi:hypothetical protein
VRIGFIGDFGLGIGQRSNEILIHGVVSPWSAIRKQPPGGNVGYPRMWILTSRADEGGFENNHLVRPAAAVQLGPLSGSVAAISYPLVRCSPRGTFFVSISILWGCP